MVFKKSLKFKIVFKNKILNTICQLKKLIWGVFFSSANYSLEYFFPNFPILKILNRKTLVICVTKGLPNFVQISRSNLMSGRFCETMFTLS